MKKSFLTRIVYANGLWMVGLLMLLLSVFGNISYFYADKQAAGISAFTEIYGKNIFDFQLDLLFQNFFVGYLFRFLLLFGSAFLLQFISSEFRLIRIRSFFPFFIFCVFSATIIPIIPLDGTSVSCFFFCWSCLRLFAACETGPVNRSVFDAFVLLAIASLFQSKIIFLVPVLWIVMGILQIFSLKSFFASLIGAFSIFWIIGGVSFLYEDFTFLQKFSQDLIQHDLINFASFSPAEIAYTSFLGILMISAMMSFWLRQHLEKLRTRNYLNSVLLLWFSLLILWLFSGNDIGLLVILFCLSTLTVAHFFSLIDTMFSRSLFFILILLSIAVYFLLGN